MVEREFSRVSIARFRGLLRVDWSEVGILWRREEKKRWRRSGWERVSEMKVVVWWIISSAVVDMVVVEKRDFFFFFGFERRGNGKLKTELTVFNLCWREFGRPM